MSIVVVGGGLAAANAVEELREQGYDGDVTVFGAEAHLPYERPPLSKGYLLGDDGARRPRSSTTPSGTPTSASTCAWATQVTRARPGRGHVTTSATGTHGLRPAPARHRGRAAAAARRGRSGARGRLPAHARRQPRACAPRSVEGGRVVIVGGGWIGLEVAAAAATAGCTVTVVETAAAARCSACSGPEVADVFADLHREHGVDLRLDAQVERRHGDRRTTASLTLGDGSGLDGRPAGRRHRRRAPTSGSRSAPGLDGRQRRARRRARCAPATRDVFAAGDVANHRHPVLGRRIRVEHWDTAIEQGKAAARNLLGGRGVLRRLPYFFTDQYDLGMEYVGNVGPDGLRRGGRSAATRRAARSPPSGCEDGRVLAGMHVNDWDAIDPIRALVGQSVDAGKLGDEGIAPGRAGRDELTNGADLPVGAVACGGG